MYYHNRLYSDTEDDQVQESELNTRRALKQLPEHSNNKSPGTGPVGLGLNSTDALLGNFRDETENIDPLSSR